MPVSMGCAAEEAGEVGKVKLKSCPEDEEFVLGWVWPCESG